MPLSEDGCIGNLRRQIQDSLVTSISERHFLPTDKLDEIFTLPVIRNAVEELKCGPDDRIRLADTIYRDGRRVFAMLIYHYRQDLIVEFRKHNALDSRLPLDGAYVETIVERDTAHRIAQEFQWGFCPYTFPKDMSECHHEVQRKIILPFIDTEQIGFGAFSDVDMMTISPSQQNFVKEAKTVQVVRKRLKKRGKTEEFEREVGCLLLLSRLQHPNIIPLWGSYTYRDEQNFLFPYIDMNLGSFLKARTRHQDFQWDFTFYSALTGLSSALSKTHHLQLNQADHDVDFEAIGYHHDLRPPNVLVSSDTFILADFGLGRLKQAGDSSHTPYKWISGDYVAPESTDAQDNPETANRATDVWAFGCLIAEVVTYMLTGAEGVEEFRRKRLTPGRLPLWMDACFYEPYGNVKQEVVDWMEALSPQPDLDSLLINLALDALHPDPQARPVMNTIYQRLKVLSTRKHFHAVQTMFRKVDPESFRYARERFEIWGSTLTLGETCVAVCVNEQSERPVEIMKILHRALREELGIQHRGGGPALSSLKRLIFQSVEGLWTLLPTNLLQSANDQWQKRILDSGLVQQMQSSHNVADGDLPAARVVDSLSFLKSEFEEEARKFKHSLDDTVPLNEILKITSIDDVYDITDEIQDEQQKSGGLRNLPKIRIYLERLTGYVNVINEVVDESHDILSLLWGSIALLLQLARLSNKAFDSLIDAVAEIGRILPDFQASVSKFIQNAEAKEILIFFFKDLLNFYGEVLTFFSHPNWMHAFDHLWPKQYSHCLEVISHIGRLNRLMRTEIRIGDIQQEDEFRKKALESFKVQTREAHGQDFHRIMTSVSPQRYDTTLYHLRGLRYRGTGDWLFVDRTFTKWLDGSQGDARVLWLKGIPGAGKTVLSSAILDKLRSIQGTKTAFAFLTYQETKTSALSTIHSLVFQLAERDEDLMAMVCESGAVDLRSDLNAASNLLSSLIHYTGSVYLVIDGVDEISEAERGRFVTELLRLPEVCEKLRIILSTRPEADLTRLLSDTAVAIQIQDHNEESIRNYVLQRTQYIFATQRVPQKAKVEIGELLAPLACRAKGMFLYARLVMDMVATIHDLSELQKELTVLPENLDAAYHRIIVRLGSHKDKRRAEKARRLLGWIAYSVAPITVEEAHQALVVIPGYRDQVFTMVAKLNVVELLGPIVEIVDTYIRFVHFTAKEYISSPHLGAQLIDRTQAILDLTMQCINYICQRHHDPDLPFKERSEKVSTGQYGFHAFATRMWFELVCKYLQSTSGANPPVELVESIQMLWESRKIQGLHSNVGGENGAGSEDDSDVESDDESDSEAIFKSLKGNQPLLYQVLCRVSRFRNSSFVFTGQTTRDPNNGRRDPFSISDTSNRIREAFDQALCDSPMGWLASEEPQCHESCANILQYYGPRPFKCKFPACKFWQHGFEVRSFRDKHERSHDKPLKCHVAGCEFGLIGFLSEQMRQKHLEQAHRSNPAQLGFDAESLPESEVEAILSNLIQENHIIAVEEALSAFPDALKSDQTRHKLRLLAASVASSDMLRLLEGPADRDVVKLISKESADCISNSIKGRNESTLRYFLSQTIPYTKVGSKGKYGSSTSLQPLVIELVSSDWLEGMKLLSKWIRSGPRDLPPVRNGTHLGNFTPIFRSKKLISAASHPAGDQQLLCLWRDSGVISLSDKSSVNQTLKIIAEFNSSITLARYLLNEGAEIDGRLSDTHRTPLHCAVKTTSAKGAEMIKFLLLNGADPEADQEAMHITVGRVRPVKKIREEKGAKCIHQWLGKTWDELVEETKQFRNGKETGKMVISGIGEGD